MNELNSGLFAIGSHCLLLAHTPGPLPQESLCVQRAAPPEIVARAGGLGKSPSVLLVVIPQRSSSRAKSGALVVIAQGNIATRPRAEPIGIRIDNLIDNKYMFSNVLGWGWISLDFL